jgi:hypothetical protein
MHRRWIGAAWTCRVNGLTERRRANADLIREKPEQVLSIITGETSVFDRHDVARALHRYIDDVDGFSNAFAAVMASPAPVELKPETDQELARYSTREMVEIERAMAASAERMSQSLRHGVHRQHVDRGEFRVGLVYNVAGLIKQVVPSAV